MKRFVLVAAALLVWSCFASTTASATFPGTNGRIAFLRGGKPQIYTMAADGSDVRQLTSFANAVAFDPAWSPDGQTIAFTKQPLRNTPSAIWTMSANGRTKIPLRRDRWFAYQTPSYSPDGSTIVYSRCYPDFSVCDLQTMNADGTSVETLTPFGIEVHDISPRYSPDGSEIAFSGFGRSGAQAAVYVMDADGSNIHAVTKPRVGAWLPDWSPDGSTLAITTHCCDAHSSAIARVDPDGSDFAPLTDPGDAHDFSPSWAPAGDAIIFERDLPDFSRFDTWIMAPDGTGAALLKKNAFEAVWGPAP